MNVVVIVIGSVVVAESVVYVCFFTFAEVSIDQTIFNCSLLPGMTSPRRHTSQLALSHIYYHHRLMARQVRTSCIDVVVLLDYFTKAQLSVFRYRAKSLPQMTSPIAIVLIVTVVFVVAEVLADVFIFAAAASHGSQPALFKCALKTEELRPYCE